MHPRRSICSRLIPSLGVALLLVALPARADVLDLTLQRLITPVASGQTLDLSKDMAAQTAYRMLLSELGVALSPSALSPADTVGYSGFQFTVDGSFTSISNRTCNAGETRDQCPWQYGVSGRDGNVPKSVPGFASTVSVMARKGIWLPLPSFELGAGATKLMQSDIFALQFYGKFALHEGYHRWPLPSFAVRGSATRVLGASQVDLTLAQLDAEVSKSFGLFGTVTFVPYLGAAILWIVARGQVLDTTPTIDAYGQGPNGRDLNANVVFPDQDVIMRWKFFGGFRLNYSVLMIAADYTITACGDFSGSPTTECDHTGAKIPDNAGTQHTVALSGGFLF